MASFHSRLKSLGLRWFLSFGEFFSFNKCFSSSNFFPFNLALRVFLTFFGIESKRRVPTMLILLILTLYGTYDILLYCFGCWFVQSFIRISQIERLHPIDKMWLVLIICLFIIISYYHLVSLHDKNWDDYLLAASQWLCKCISKTSIRSLVPLSLFQVIRWNTVWLYVLSGQSTPS